MAESTAGNWGDYSSPVTVRYTAGAAEFGADMLEAYWGKALVSNAGTGGFYTHTYGQELQWAGIVKAEPYEHEIFIEPEPEPDYKQPAGRYIEID